MDPSFRTKASPDKTEAEILSSLEAIAENKGNSFNDFSKLANQKLQNVKLTIEMASKFYFRIRNIVKYRFDTAKLQNLFFDYVSLGFLGKSVDSQFQSAKQNNQSLALAQHYLRLEYQGAFRIIYNQWDNLGLSKEQRYDLYDVMGTYYGAIDLFPKIDQDERIYLCKKIFIQRGFDCLEGIIAKNGFDGIPVSEIYQMINIILKECNRPWRLAAHINQLGLKTLPLQDRVALCKAAMRKPASVAEYVQELCEFALNELPNEEKVAFFAESVTGEDAIEVLEHYEKFGLEDISLELKIKLYKSIHDKQPNGMYAVNRNFSKWQFVEAIAKIADVSERVSIVRKIVEVNIYTRSEFVKHAALLKLHEATLLERFDLCRLLNDENIFQSMGYLQELQNMNSISEKLTYCEKIIESADRVALGILDYFDEIGLGEANQDDLIKLWKKIAFSSTSGAYKAITTLKKFVFNCEETRLELCKDTFARFRFLFKEQIVIKADFFAKLGLTNQRILILLAQHFLQKGNPKDLDHAGVLDSIPSDATKRQMYLELLRPPSTMKDECTSHFSSTFSIPVDTILPIIRIKEGVPLDKEALELFVAFVRSTPKLCLLVPFLDDILKKDEHLQCVLLEWIAYTAGLFYDLSEERIFPIEKLGVLKDIYEHHNRSNRFIFTSLLRYQDFYPEINLSTSWGRLSVGLVSIFERETAIELLSMIEKTKFKDPKRYNSLVQLLHEISSLGKAFTKEQLHNIATKIKSILSLKGKKQKKGTVKQKRVIETISETFETFTNILKIFGKSELLNCLELGKDPQPFFIDNFQSLFTIQDTQNFAEQYQNTFARFRNPMAIYTYLRSINSLPEEERSRMHVALNAYVNAVLQGTFHNIRYNTDQSEHVKMVFSILDKKDWIASAKSFDFVIKKSEVIKDYKTFFLQKIKRDGHIDKKLVPRLMSYLNNEHSTIVESEKELEIFQNYAIQLCEREITAENFVSKVEGMNFINSFPDFPHDLSTLIPTMGCGKYSISESDEACDLLLLGTEITGSCQRVDGGPSLNKGLLSYLMNGEIRAILVKKDGKIVARSIIRLLLDIEKNTPVILLERIYSNFDEEMIKETIISWARNKAMAMELPLVSVEVMTKDCIRYNGAISSLGGYAPFTYSDACGGIQSGPFMIPLSYELK